jgi:hypothetical protein
MTEGIGQQEEEEFAKETQARQEKPPPPSISDIKRWIKEERARELRNAPKEQNTPAAGMTMGAIETLDHLRAFIDGDSE